LRQEPDRNVIGTLPFNLNRMAPQTPLQVAQNKPILNREMLRRLQ